MLCNSLSVVGWQNVRNFRVRLNALRYLALKLSKRLSLLLVKGKIFNSVTRIPFCTIIRPIDNWFKSLNTLWFKRKREVANGNSFTLQVRLYPCRFCSV